MAEFRTDILKIVIVYAAVEGETKHLRLYRVDVRLAAGRMNFMPAIRFKIGADWMEIFSCVDALALETVINVIARSTKEKWLDHNVKILLGIINARLCNWDLDPWH